jgi:transposase
MDPDQDELRQLCIEIVEEDDAAAVTPGIVRQELRVEHDIVYEHNTVFELMHEMEDDGELVYHLGEYNEFAVPE